MAGREIRITRTFDAPRELVFRAWLDPDQLAEWLAPAGLEVPRASLVVDARVGGRIEYSMVDPSSGEEDAVLFEIVQISEPELLLLESPPRPEFGFLERMTTRVVFEEDGDRTTITVTQAPHTGETGPDAQAGWTSILEKLEALLLAR
ncbi:MAG TPA: SRPBCC domain-containing protein [Solirubrobacterales bacterium]|nr:SRPBCC domain-containing protein [Solirubrobacterales bacterium]